MLFWCRGCGKRKPAKLQVKPGVCLDCVKRDVLERAA